MSFATPEEIARHVAGHWHNGTPAQWGTINFDTRKLQPGEVFVALQDKRDGHEFVPAAKEAGASAAIVARTIDCDLPQLVVANPQTALNDLATVARVKYTGEVVIITGSNGKSTTKEMLASILRTWVGDAKVVASPGNLNNHLGLPLSLLSLADQHEYAVLEAGMNHAGELTKLSALAQAKNGIITNAGRAHLGNFNNATEIAQAKGEIITGLQDGGTIVLNADDAHFDMWCDLAGERQVLAFSHQGKGGAVCRRLQDRDFIFAFDGTAQPLEVTLQVSGNHNEQNALAAATMAWFLGVPSSYIVDGLEEFTGVPGRQEVYLLRNMVLIDDTYNASPESVAAAVAALAARPEANKILILGDMLELGEQSVTAHITAIEEALAAGVRYVLGHGDSCQAAIAKIGPPALYFADKAELISQAQSLVNSSGVILVKGSRGMRMDEVVGGLRQG